MTESLDNRRVMMKLLGTTAAHVYMIRNKKTGLFSSGSSYPSWEKKGKSWRMINHVRAHANRFTGSNFYQNFYKDAEIVEMELIQVKTHPFVNPKKKKNEQAEE